METNSFPIMERITQEKGLILWVPKKPNEKKIKEALKEHIRRIEETEAEIEMAKEKHEIAKIKYKEILENNNLLLKLCLQKAASQPIKPKE